MADKLNFSRSSTDWPVLESDSFWVDKDELKYILENETIRGADVQAKIDDDEHISLDMPEDPRVKVHFWIVRETDDQWIVNVTAPPDAEITLPERLIELISGKEPVPTDSQNNASELDD